MRYRYKLSLIIFVLVVSLPLFSCTVQQNITEPVVTLTNTPLPQIASTTALSLPMSTVVLQTVTPPPTISGISTLPPEHALIALEDLLKNDCGLPCWAGITPGKTLLIDASKALLPFSGISNWNSLGRRGGQISIDYPKDDLIIIIMSFEILSSKNDNRVQLLHIFSEALREIEQGNYLSVYDAKPYHEMFGAYSLQNLLATYGKPSEVYMTVEINEAEYNSPDFVLLWLLYPEKGFVAKYTANAEEIDDKVYGCLSKSFVELWLFHPYETDKYKEELLTFDEELGYVFPVASSRTKTISDGMDMTIDEFYQIFNQPTIQCSETPSSNWPNWWR